MSIFNAKRHKTFSNYQCAVSVLLAWYIYRTGQDRTGHNRTLVIGKKKVTMVAMYMRKIIVENFVQNYE